MENETKQTNTNEQEPDIFAQKLREADSLYAILSGCTKEPYVYCDPETMDDAILLFTDEEGAKAERAFCFSIPAFTRWVSMLSRYTWARSRR